MTRTPRAIILLTLWLVTFFAGPVLPAFAASCGTSSILVAPSPSPTSCPMQHGAVKAAEHKTCCCSPAGQTMVPSGSEAMSASANACDCSVQQGLPPIPSRSTEAPLPSIALALSETPILAVVPPLAHLAADAPLPPFAARLQIPQRALDTGRAPPAA